MDFDQAVEWVTKNKWVIEKKAAQYCRYSPYELIDYQQVAYEASLVASLRCQDVNLKFEAVFWSVFKTMVRDITPNTKHDLGSNSISSDTCEEMVDIFPADLPFESVCSDNLTELIYQAVCDRLPPVERETLGLFLGFTSEGYMSKSEIARKRGCSKVSVRQSITRAMARIKKLVDEGSVDPVQVAVGQNSASNSLFSA